MAALALRSRRRGRGVRLLLAGCGAVLQRETDVVSFGDPRHEWNQHVVEHFAPLLAPCASLARIKDKPIECRLNIRPTREVTIPVYPEASLTPSPPDEHADPEAEG